MSRKAQEAERVNEERRKKENRQKYNCLVVEKTSLVSAREEAINTVQKGTNVLLTTSSSDLDKRIAQEFIRHGNAQLEQTLPKLKQVEDELDKLMQHKLR